MLLENAKQQQKENLLYEIRYRGECGQQSISINAYISLYFDELKTFYSTQLHANQCNSPAKG